MHEFERLKADFGWNIADHAKLTNGVWQVLADEEKPVSFPDDGNELCAELEAGSFWFRYRNRVIDLFLEKYLTAGDCLWDIGAGNGFVADYLAQKRCRTVAVEPGPQGAACAAKTAVEASVCGFFEDLRLPENALKAIGCFDVLEHLEKPEKIVQEFRRTLELGGILVVTVPAYRFLWSDADVQAGHFKRYTVRALETLMHAHGFQTCRLGYMMACLVPAVFLARTLASRRKGGLTKEEVISQLKPSAGKLSTFLIKKMLDIEYYLQRYGSVPFGTSVVGVFRKN